MSFPTPYIHLPTVLHTHTVLLLHGRAAWGSEFAHALFNVEESTIRLPSLFPSVRFVFPTATTQLSTVFQENLTEWFDIYSLGDPDARLDLQLPGLKASVSYILKLIDEEVELLGGDSRKLILGGISMGMATSLMAFLARGKGLGGYIGASGWMPLMQEIVEGDKEGRGVVEVVREVFEIEGEGMEGWEGLKNTPVWLGHGIDDAYVDVELGRKARNVLEEVVRIKKLEWMSYEGADEEGHWLKEPEELEDIIGFLRKIGVRDGEKIGRIDEGRNELIGGIYGLV